MFKPREAFLTVEHFADHIADVIASEFRITKARLEGDVAELKDRIEALENRLRLQAPIPVFPPSTPPESQAEKGPTGSD